MALAHYRLSVRSVGFSGLVMRLAIDVSDVRRPRGRPPLRWIDTVRHDLLSGVQLSVKDAMVHALNRKAWLHIVHRCVKLNWVTCDSVCIRYGMFAMIWAVNKWFERSIMGFMDRKWKALIARFHGYDQVSYHKTRYCTEKELLVPLL